MKEPIIFPCDLAFIRCQSRAAVPLLAELYRVTVEKVKEIRLKRGSGEQMPLRLLRQLVEQRRTPARAEEFLHRASSILLAEREA